MSIFEKARELAVISSSAAVIGWDQETYLPAHAAKHRADQLAWLSSRAHELATSDAWREELEAAEAADTGENFKHSANLRELRREFDRATKLTVELVARDSVASSLAKHAWAEARERSDFSRFAPHLETLLGIAREKADLWGYRDEPYDALLEGYERATSTAAVANLFDEMRPALREIAAKAVENSKSHSPELPPGPYPVAAQQQFNAQVATAIGFDFNAGRIDTTTHPFCTTLGPRDIRLTTRYMESDFTSSLFGVLHEAGHGLYEQGVPAEDFRPAVRHPGFAGHPRIPVAAMGKPRRTVAGILGEMVSRLHRSISRSLQDFRWRNSSATCGGRSSRRSAWKRMRRLTICTSCCVSASSGG